MDGTGLYALCPTTKAPRPLPWGDPKLIGLGFSVFATIILVDILGSPLMKSASIIFGLAVGSAISGATGYWSAAQIHEAPTATFVWTQTFDLRVDGSLILPLMIMFACEVSVHGSRSYCSCDFCSRLPAGHDVYAFDRVNV